MDTILIVDDQPEITKLLEVVLRKEGRQFLVANNGKTAIAMASQVRVGCVLLDVMMPGEMDGYEVARVLKSRAKRAEAPIIHMTANANEAARIKSRESGADDLVFKPFDIQALKNKIEQLFH